MGIDTSALTASLHKLATDRSAEDGVVPTLRRVIDACVDLFGVSGSGIMLADEHNVTRYVTATDGAGRVLETVESESGQGPCTEAFINNQLVATTDLLAEVERWPQLAAAIAPFPVRAVLGIPIRIGGVPVGTMDVFYDHAHEWDESEQVALTRYGDVVETTLTAALQAHTAGQLAGQLQYALDYRVIIERGVGYLMARDGIDEVTAFNRLRRASRSTRTKIGRSAEILLSTGRLPDAQPPGGSVVPPSA